MTTTDTDAAIRAALGLTPAAMWNRGMNMADCRAIWATATNAALERAAATPGKA